MDLIPHLSEIVRRGALDVVMTWGEPIAYSGEIDRKVLARTLETSVRRLTVAALRGQVAEPRPAA
jgi:1-acyl-sn-glycerol-3-phosphate acyltransferase